MLIDCSSFLELVLRGISYNDLTSGNGATGFYKVNLGQNSYAQGIPRRFYANELAHWCVDRGYGIIPSPDYSNVRPGDLAFFSFPYTGTFHQNAFMQIDHASLVVGMRDKNFLTVLHGNNMSTGAVGFYDVPLSAESGISNVYNNALVLLGRIPFRCATNPTDLTPINNLILNGESEYFSAASASTTKVLTLDLTEPLQQLKPYTLILNIDIQPRGTLRQDTYPVVYNSTGGSNPILQADAGYVYMRSLNNVGRPDDHIYRIYFTPTSTDNHLSIYKGGPTSIANASRSATFYYARLYHGFLE